MACLREMIEHTQDSLTGPYGVLASRSAGRPIPEPECDMRTCFQRDTDRIIHSKSFRRLKHKTQVFLRPEGDHYRTRLTHTFEVARVARTISRALRLNEDLTEAIALGHDLGHTPFGHAGERALAVIMPGGFRHYEQSLRVVDRIEKEGRGLNLCHETRMGILNHTTGQPRASLEADVVRLSDRIAYINHDTDDAIRAGILTADDLPPVVLERIGRTHSQRINAILTDIIANSGEGELKMSPDMAEAVDTFKAYLTADVYTNPVAKSEESKVTYIIGGIWDYYMKNFEKLPEEYRRIAEEEGCERALCDYISGMTDSFSVRHFSSLFVPAAWSQA